MHSNSGQKVNRKFTGTLRGGLYEVNPFQSPETGLPEGGRSQEMISEDTIMVIDSPSDALEEHRKQKAFRKAAKEQQAFAEESRASMEKGILLESLSNVQINPLPSVEAVHTPFPIDHLPSSARKWVGDMAEAFGVHPGVAGTLLMAVISISLRGNFKVRRHRNHVELITLYVLIIMASGKMKSPMMDAALAPIKAIEKELKAKYFQDKELRETHRDLAQKRIHYLESQAARKGRIEELLEEIVRLRRSVPAKLHVPVLLTSCFTPEGLEREASRQEGKIAIASSELGTLKVLSQKKDDFILHGWDGEAYVNTKCKEPIRIDVPSVSILVATQDRTATTFLSNEDLQEDGFLGRFICLVPPDLTMPCGGGATREVSEEGQVWLDRIVRELTSMTIGQKSPKVLHFEDQALRNWYSLESQAKLQAEVKGIPVALRSFYRKLAGTALRFAGIVHILRCQESGLEYDSQIQQQSVDAGLHIALFYEQHARLALDVQRNKDLSRAVAIVEYLRSRGQVEVTVREINRGKHMLRGDVKRLEAPLDMLEKHGYIARYQQGGSKRILINPNLKYM